MLLPAVFHENLFDDWFDPFFDDMDRELNRESRQVFGKRGANMMKTDVKDTGSAYEVAVDPVKRHRMPPGDRKALRGHFWFCSWQSDALYAGK